jgi:hypothetical protein
MRSNFGAELRLGNGPGADGTWMDYLHPSKNVFEMGRYRDLGELAYVAEREREAIAYIREDYARFAKLSLKRFVYYWGGLPKASNNAVSAYLSNSIFLASSVLGFWGLGRALRKRTPGAWLFFWLVLSYPLVYYFVFPHPRYRHPIEPELGILIVYVISEVESRGRPRLENRSLSQRVSQPERSAGSHRRVSGGDLQPEAAALLSRLLSAAEFERLQSSRPMLVAAVTQEAL